ncbi:hypothetical protein M5362_27460 [Streptomyces sp. Je 1-79]|uniref:hypothetical protein n=1 Tax=Streptomyces sp. Je 1-79 TaxID=2943847 RepID=UPI0021A50073|nr:hypothetical protein [Streptomyces sp. Je 1-79]MCT4356864.1 hypothetical protein [Streptomyces sp. Je 1-79]
MSEGGELYEARYGQRYEDRTWAWERPHPLRFLLVAEEWDGEQTVWARCAGIRGLFADEEPPRERLTLTGCVPEGRLRKAVDGAARERDRLGDLSLHIDDETTERPTHDWELADVVVLDSRPNADDASRVDVLIETAVADRPDSRTEPRSGRVRIYNGWGGGWLGECRRVEGLYKPERPVARPALTLVGCQPEELMLRRLTTRRWAGDPVELFVLDRAGRVVRVMEHFFVHVREARPSVLGGALVDIAIDGGLSKPLPHAARPVWDAWHEGAPSTPNAWAGLDTRGRAQWLGFTRPVGGEDRVGDTCHLDGRFATDIPGVQCAVGEAIGGPGAHFARCWGALRGCPCGGNRLPGPVTLVWHDAHIAREALASVSADAAGELTYFESVVRLLEQSGIVVEQA